MIARLAAALWLLTLAAPALAQVPAYASVAELRARYADRASRYATIAGVEVHYKDEGRGPALLLIHGSSSTMQTWDGVVPLLKGRYRVIRYDVPGQGLSADVTDEVAARVKPTDIAAGLLATLGVAKVTVIGVSSGGTAAAYLAADHPELVERVITSNAPSDPVDTSHLVATPAWAKAQADAKANGGPDKAFYDEFLTYFAGDARRFSVKTRADFAGLNLRTPNKNAIALIAKVADHDRAVAEFAGVRVPILLIWGGSDKLLPPGSARVLAGYFKNTDPSIVYLPDVGHFPPIETPARFVAVATAWIKAAVSK